MIYTVKLHRCRHQELSFRQRTQFELEKEIKIRIALLFSLLSDCCLGLIKFCILRAILYISQYLFWVHTPLWTCFQKLYPNTLQVAIISSEQMQGLTQPRLCFPETANLERWKSLCQHLHYS